MPFGGLGGIGGGRCRPARFDTELPTGLRLDDLPELAFAMSSPPFDMKSALAVRVKLIILHINLLL